MSTTAGPSNATTGGGTPETIEVTGPAGTVRGLLHEGVARFAGVPFAATTSGAGRFAPPVPLEGFGEVLDATEFRAISPQNPSMMDALFGGEAEQWDEDCLHLNVWTPDPTPDEPLPVMVWIHGGGFEMGSGSSPIYHGESFARSGVVYVSVNYRLGSLGFLELGHLDGAFAGSGNVGLLDQVEALRWVQRNIAAFGGDPGRVTIFGESAGAMSVSSLLTMPAARGLFHGAIAQSGALAAAKAPADARDTTAEFMEHAGMGGIEELLAAPVQDLLVAHSKMSTARIGDPEAVLRRHRNPLAFLPFRPVADGSVLPSDPLAQVRSGQGAQVPLLIGTNLEEWNLFALMSPPSTERSAVLARLAHVHPDPESVVAAYESEHPDASIAELENAVFTDLVFRAPAVQLADAHRPHAPVWQYRFDWRSPAMGGLIGASHAVEIPFVFDMVTDHRLHVLLGPEAPVDLASSMHRAWIEFARHGRPDLEGIDWPAVDGGSRPVLRLDSRPEVLVDPHAGSLGCWTS